MRNDSLNLEEIRLSTVETISDYESIHERHRAFPEIFEQRNHKSIIDLSAGVGIVGKRVKELYKSTLLCNEVSPKCLDILKQNEIETVSFDLDSSEEPFPLKDNSFDAIISLATIEHLINIDHFIMEIKRIMSNDGFLYISAPNYSGLLYLLPFLRTGRTFHDPLNKLEKYEFYAHVRYFTYRTLCEYICSFGFAVHTVYLPIPKESSHFIQLKKKSKIKAFFFKNIMKSIYSLCSPRWASEPIICFTKQEGANFNTKRKPRKKIL